MNAKLRKEKEFRQLIKTRKQLFELDRNLGYRTLTNPIRHGWYKEIIFTQHIERYKNCEAMIELYSVVQKRFWGRTKAEAHKKWMNQTSEYFIAKDFPTISRKTYNKLSKKAQMLCVPFFYRNERHKLRLRFYINIPKSAYKIKYTRAYITHQKIIDPNLESQMQYIENKLFSSKFFNTYAGLWKPSKYYNSKKLKQHRQQLKIKQQLKTLSHYKVSDVLNNEISWEIN